MTHTDMTNESVISGPLRHRRPGRLPLVVAAWLAAGTAALHLVAGTLEVQPLLDSALQEEVRLLLYACWHGISVLLAFSAAAFYIGCRDEGERHRSMLIFVSLTWIAFGVVFIAVALVESGPGMLLELPQWTLLIPIGALGLYGCHRRRL